jgi:hypothetical protein
VPDGPSILFGDFEAEEKPIEFSSAFRSMFGRPFVTSIVSSILMSELQFSDLSWVIVIGIRTSTQSFSIPISGVMSEFYFFQYLFMTQQESLPF